MGVVRHKWEEGFEAKTGAEPQDTEKTGVA